MDNKILQRSNLNVRIKLNKENWIFTFYNVLMYCFKSFINVLVWNGTDIVLHNNFNVALYDVHTKLNNTIIQCLNLKCA